jgi:hypothetical protein
LRGLSASCRENREAITSDLFAESRGWTVRFNTSESVEIGFVAVVLREATVSAAKENGCNVGSASNPAHSRRG